MSGAGRHGGNREAGTRRALLIAFHFPPQRGSSGIQRTLKFVRYLPEHGWQAAVLSAHPRAYEGRDDSQLGEIPPGTPVVRAFALDTARHLSVAGRYTRWLALPDRWASWVLGAVPAGLGMVRRLSPELIWSTHPIASAHLVGLLLHKLTGLPWVADLRDPMTEPAYPRDRLTWRVWRWLERATVHHCSAIVFTTPGALRTYRARYPEQPAGKFRLIENGYDDDNFIAAGATMEEAAPPLPATDRPVVLLHSGVIYPLERDPVPLFQALAALRAQDRIGPATLRVLLRATGHDDYLRGLLDEYGLHDLVELALPLPYRAALAEMLAADGLLLMQAANCNDQIPAKLYEYLRARRPVLTLADPAGDTAAAMRAAGVDTIARLDDRDSIMLALPDFLALLRQGAAPLPALATSGQHSRQARAAQLAALFDEIVAGRR